MDLEAGMVLEGKVTGITKFGAFVDLEDGKTGMVHISEVAPTFVNDINDYLKEGQTVKVKVLSVGEGGKISLSIKKAMSASENGGKSQNNNNRQQNRSSQPPYRSSKPNTRISSRAAHPTSSRNTPSRKAT